MGYQVGRSKRIEETLDLVDSEGVVQCAIPVKLNVSDIARQYRTQYLQLAKAQQAYAALQQAQGGEKAVAVERAEESLGDAVLGLFRLVFGEDGLQQILNFYDGCYLEMLENILPFLTNVVAPAVQADAAQRKQRIAQNYGISKIGKWRR